jgi:hypothetical protein
MSLRKPLVIISGQVQNLPAGDTLDAPVSEVDLIALVNGNASALIICTPVYVVSAGTMDKAKADAAGTTDVLGLVKDASIAASATGNVQTDGVLVATTAQWDAVTGGSGGLTAGSKYYLDPDTAGMLTTTAPTTTGDFVAPVGKALSTTELEITIFPTVKL